MSNPKAVQTIEYRIWIPEAKNFDLVSIINGKIDANNLPTDDNGVEWDLFTGYKDMNGEKVYRYDIVKYHDEDSEEYDQYWLVEFEHGGFWVDNTALWDYAVYVGSEPTDRLERLEKVGNIYENTELIPELPEKLIKQIKEKGVI